MPKRPLNAPFADVRTGQAAAAASSFRKSVRPRPSVRPPVRRRRRRREGYKGRGRIEVGFTVGFRVRSSSHPVRPFVRREQQSRTETSGR